MYPKVTTVALFCTLAFFAMVNVDASRFCGRHLTDVMNIVCNGTFQGVFNKRSGEFEDHNDEQRSFLETLPKAWAALGQHQLVDENGVDSLTNGQQRFRRTAANAKLDYYLERNIVHVCCNNPCSMTQMMAYCRA